MTLIYVALGGAIGSVLRYLAGGFMLRAYGAVFPYGTLAVNVAGSFAMGLLAAWLLRVPDAHPALHPLLVVGVLGGFTTFSAFSLDTMALIQRGEILSAAVYVALSVGASLAALAAGFTLMKACI